ncbi:FMN-linked oxidoreductase [Durotheca rogersii]|uniref:FMN-linked oxidoreductase n=1 Tax=Durotheca rogersii TaxID=419775 RepID=UPI00221E3ACF|nr:FMN-linked oxidoreductase [Durotheca rogersii]KAI5859373.1 FMN-linked oxidoreductase [Durotheca rogersii]
MAPSTANGSLAGAKLHGRAFYESIGSPKFVLAPMVDQSEFAWRMLTRSFLTPAENAKLLAYTPMLHARLYEETAKYRESHFEATRPPESHPGATSPAPSLEPSVPFLDGNPALDRPLFVQFCANDPEHLLGAARLVAPYCDAVDLNLGCPQGIARRGHYGAFLQEDQELIYNLINTLHKNLPVPVTAKIRILETKEDTLAYAKNVLAAGASIITVHGRRREQKGHMTGLADWEYLRYLRENLPKETVIFANGNVLQHGDLEMCLEATGADAVMSAEGNLSDPGIFAEPPAPGQEGREYWRGIDGKGGWRIDAVFRRYMDIIHRHAFQREPPTRRPLFVVGDDEGWLVEDGKEGGQEEEGPARKKRKRDGGGKNEKCTSPNVIGMRPHLFHLMRHLISIHTDIRDALARCHVGDIPTIEKILDMVERRVAQGLIEYERTGGESIKTPEPEPKVEGDLAAESAGTGDVGGRDHDPESSVATVKKCKRPWWVAQPIVRPLPKEALANGSISLSKKEKRKQEEAAAAAAHADGHTEVDAIDQRQSSSSVEGIKDTTANMGKPAATTSGLVCG